MNTRKKVIKTVYKDENDSEEETGDFSDSGSEAKISDESHESSSGEEEDYVASSGDEFTKSKNTSSKQKTTARKPKFAKSFVSKISKQSSKEENADAPPVLFSVKDLTDEDKLLPSVLNLSESDSSDDESPKPSNKNTSALSSFSQTQDDSDSEVKTEFKDVWSTNLQDNSEEIARKAFLKLEQHKSKIEQTKAAIHSYSTTQEQQDKFDVSDLLAQGEEVLPEKKALVKKKAKSRKKDDSESEMEDWEEVQDSKPIPQQGLQLFVELPDVVRRKTKVIDVEMMMKRKMNRVKKEYQVYMHKVHILCWLGHGNYVSRVLNDQELLAASLSMVPGKECYPGERVDLKYVEQITTWFKDKLTLKQDKNENKFRPKAPPLKEILLSQIKTRVVTAKKYSVFVFVAMLRAIGLQCRVMFNFVTLPIKPPSSELCSLSTKPKEEKDAPQKCENAKECEKKSTKSTAKKRCSKAKSAVKVTQLDGNYDSFDECEDFDNIMQVDGNSDVPPQTRTTRGRKAKNLPATEEDVSPPKRARKSPSPKPTKTTTRTGAKDTSGPKPKSKPDNVAETVVKEAKKSAVAISRKNSKKKEGGDNSTNDVTLKTNEDIKKDTKPSASPRKTRSANKDTSISNKTTKADPKKSSNKQAKSNTPTIVVTKATELGDGQSSKYFESENNSDDTKIRAARKRSQTTNPANKTTNEKEQKPYKTRTKSAPGTAVEKSKYFDEGTESHHQSKKLRLSLKGNKAASNKSEDEQRVSHRDLAKKKIIAKNDVTADLKNIIMGRIKEAKEEAKKGIVKGKAKNVSDDDSDFLPEVEQKDESDDDFKPCKISPKPSATRKKIDRRVLSSDDDIPTNKIDVWCEVYVEELEQWVAVNVVKGKVHCAESIYSGATHPVCYVVGWDNNNFLKDLTRRYVPHWNTVTRKQRVEPTWWDTAVKPYLGPKTARDREEDEQLDRMQMEAPLPKSIAEYKNHPLYALQRHILKFEAIYPPDATTLGFVRGEAVYPRACVYTLQSREKWLSREAKVVRLGEKPYKIVKARPKWDKLSNKIITDTGPLELFGPWQVADYEPPTAEGGIVPRNAYGNVELFKPSMLPKGTVLIKLPGLNKVAKQLNIDCASAITGFDFNGGWAHPVYDGFVVCKEFEDIITEAWVADQENLERKEQEKTEARVYGNWRRLIKGLLIRERLKDKYGFQEPTTSQDKKKSKGPRLVITKR